MAYEFEFKGGIIQKGSGGGVCKFLLFLLNGTKEVSLSQSVKFGFVDHKSADSVVKWNPNIYMASLPIIKIIFFEDGGFGREKLSQSFWLALGKKIEKQIVTIKPRMAEAVNANFKFCAEATFLKKSEVLAILDEDSISAKVLKSQLTPPVNVLRQIIQIERVGVPNELKLASHGGVRKLRIRS